MRPIMLGLASLFAIAPFSWLINTDTSLAASPSRLVSVFKFGES
jgi:hypothetical protein